MDAALTDQYLVADAYLVGVTGTAAELARIIGKPHEIYLLQHSNDYGTHFDTSTLRLLAGYLATRKPLVLWPFNSGSCTMNIALAIPNV